MKEEGEEKREFFCRLLLTTEEERGEGEGVAFFSSSIASEATIPCAARACAALKMRRARLICSSVSGEGGE